MQTTNEAQAQLEVARADAAKLRAKVAEHQAAAEETNKRLESAANREAFTKAIEDGAWLAHLIEKANEKIEAHRVEVLAPLELKATQAQREHEAAVVLAARTESEEAIARAGELARDAVRAIAVAIESLKTFEQVRSANLTGAGPVSLATLRTGAIVSVMNGKIGAEFTRYIQMHAGGGELQFHATFPITIPQHLR